MPQLILIVDDDEKSRRLACDVLNHHGFRALPAGSGEEALELARPLPPALVLLDIQLPGLSGYETIGKLRELHPDRRLRVLAMTASVTSADQGRITGAGFDGFVAKPIVRVSELVRTVRAALALDAPVVPDASAAPAAPAP